MQKVQHFFFLHSKKITALAIIFALMLVPHAVLRADDVNISLQLENPLAGSGVNTISDFIRKLLDIVLTIGVPIVALFIIYSGFLFVTAGGNEKKIEHAKENLLWVLVGAAILLGAWVLANALGETVEELQRP